MAAHDTILLGVAVWLKLLVPSLVTWLAVDTWAPLLLTWWYPLMVTLLTLHRQMEDKEQNSSGNKKSKGYAPKESSTKADRKDDPDVTYWLHFWILRAGFEAVLALLGRVAFGKSMAKHSIVCQAELYLYFWILCAPQALSHLAKEEEKDSLLQQPVQVLPTLLFFPVVKPCFDTVSRATASPKMWKRIVASKLESPLQLLLTMKFLTPDQSDALQEGLANSPPLILPALTLLCPGCITYYGVWYIQYMVPLAFSFRALHGSRRVKERLMCLQFWILHGLLTGFTRRMEVLLQWVPLAPHCLFLMWCMFWLLPQKVIPKLYQELHFELQAFGLLPATQAAAAVTLRRRHLDALHKKNDGYNRSTSAPMSSIQRTHTARVLSYLTSKLPSAINDDELDKQGGQKGDHSLGEDKHADDDDAVSLDESLDELYPDKKLPKASAPSPSFMWYAQGASGMSKRNLSDKPAALLGAHHYSGSFCHRHLVQKTSSEDKGVRIGDVSQ